MPEEYDINRKISFINSYESESYSFQLCKYSLKLQKVKTRDSRKNPRKFQSFERISSLSEEFDSF